MIKSDKIRVIPPRKKATYIPAEYIDRSLVPNNLNLNEKQAMVRIKRDLIQLNKLIKQKEVDYHEMFELTSRLNIILKGCMNYTELKEKK